MVDSTVVFITNGRDRGGTEDHVLQIAQGLISRRFRVASILSPRPDLGWLRKAFLECGVEVHDAPERSEGTLGAIARVQQLTSLLRPYRDGILHLQFNGHPSGELTMLAAKLAGFKRIVRTDHNPPLPTITPRERVSLKMRDALLNEIIVISEQDKRWYAERLGRDPAKMTVIAHGVNVSHYRKSPAAGTALRQRFGIGSREFVVGNVANLGDSKGTPEFVRMISELGRRSPDVRGLIVGDTFLRPGYEKLAAELGLGSRLIFAGRVESEGIPAYLSAFDVFVLPSLQESGPYTILEAMSAGLPVVATSVGFVPQVVEDGISGLVVPPGDVPALAHAVERIMHASDRGRVMGQAAQRKIVDHYSTDAMVENVMNVYQRLGAKRHDGH